MADQLARTSLPVLFLPTTLRGKKAMRLFYDRQGRYAGRSQGLFATLVSWFVGLLIAAVVLAAVFAWPLLVWTRTVTDACTKAAVAANGECGMQHTVPTATGWVVTGLWILFLSWIAVKVVQRRKAAAEREDFVACNGAKLEAARARMEAETPGSTHPRDWTPKAH